MTRAMVTIRELDLSSRVPSFPGLYGGIVIPAKKGPVNEAQMITTDTDLLKYFTPDKTVKVGYDTSYYSALAFLIKSNKLWVVRAANAPLYGGLYLGQSVEEATLTVVATDFAVNALTLNHTLAADLAAATTFFENMSTGDKVKIALGTGGVVPTGLVVGTTYYLILWDPDTYRIQFAASAADALLGTAVAIDDAGTDLLTITVNGSLANGSIGYGMTVPANYDMESSDGKPAGVSSAFTVSMDLDNFTVSSEFYALCATGDAFTITAAVYPIDGDGDALATATPYYIIKSATADTIQFAESLILANAGTHIELASGGTTVVATLTAKVDLSVVTPENVADDFTCTATFYATVETDMKVLYTVETAYPTVDAGAALDAVTEYYIIKTGVANELQLSRTAGGAAITFSTDGTGAQTWTLVDYDDSSTCTPDLSTDTLTIDATLYGWVVTGTKVQATTVTTLPSGLSLLTDYYVIKSSTANEIQLATSLALAELGTAVEINSEGTGIHTLTYAENSVYYGYDRACLLIHGKNQGVWNNSIYVKILAYPYGVAADWSADELIAANTVKEPDCFYIYVYTMLADGTMSELENPILCSRVLNKLDGRGNNVYVENAVLRSNYIDVIDNTAVYEGIQPSNQATYLVMANGSDGGTVSDTHMLAALDILSNKRELALTIIMDGGWATASYGQGIISLCETRKDCFGVLSTPIAAEQSSSYLADLLTYRNTTLNGNTSYAGLFTPHLEITDRYNDRNIYVPVDGYQAAAISETASNYEMWYPPTGPRRGVLSGVIGLSRIFTEGDMDVLYDNEINPVEFYPGKGIRLWGQKTLLARPSSLDRINVRLLLITIEPAIAEFLEDYIFQFNDALERALVTSGITSYMEGIKARRGVYAFQVVCDTSNNTAEDIDNKKMVVYLYVQPVQAAEFIEFTTIIVRTGATFSLA